MTDPFMLALTHLFVFFVGWFWSEEIWSVRRARKDAICPVCLAPTDDDGVVDRD